MAYNNVPVNGWPQIKDLEKLDALAKSIENMPTFTSNDKAFLEELPAFPLTDGKKVLTAATNEGTTSLAYEEIPDELPADPVSDGTRILTATTSGGETVKSWETQEAGENQVYSTTPVKIGKWTDGKGVYRVVYQPSTAVVVANNNWTDIGMSASGIDTLLKITGIASDGACCAMVGAKDNGNIICLASRPDGAFTVAAFVVEYVVPGAA